MKIELKYIKTLVLILAISAVAANAQERFFIRDLAPTPPMGWNSFDAYDSRINEAEFKANVDVQAEKLLPYGYDIAVVDYLWFNPCSGCIQYPGLRKGHGNIRYANDGGPVDTVTMDAYGRLLPSPNRFPSAADGNGFKALADYVHSKGMKFGIHIMRGIHRQAVYLNTPIMGTAYTARDIAKTYDTCKWSNHMYGVDPNAPGAQEYYNSLFKMYASWGVDFIKADDMMVPPFHQGEIDMMWKAIQNSGRPMLLSLSCGEAPIAHAGFLRDNSHMYRISIDFWDYWEAILRNFELLNAWSPFIGPSSWPDADMIPFGMLSLDDRPHGPERMSKFTHDEHITLMTLWSIARSPLMIGSDLVSTPDSVFAYLTNSEVLEVNQHSVGNRQVYRQGDAICWFAEIPESDDYYFALFNIGDKTREVKFEFEHVGVRGNFEVRDLWEHENKGEFLLEFSAKIPSHGAGLYKMTKK